MGNPMRTFTRCCLLLLVLNCGSCAQKVSTSAGAPSGATVAPTSNEPFDIYGRYIDSFSDLSAAVQRFENGSQDLVGAQRTRVAFPFGASSDKPLILQVIEDQQSHGFDGEPGVLAFRWDTLPSTLAYSGFVYQGRTSQSISLPLLQEAKSADDLDSLRLRFRYKGLKSNLTDVAFPVKCRVEPNIPDSYSCRLELITITATDHWQLFESILGDGGNSKAFLEYIASDSFDGNFKLSWSQSGPITNYAAATLLIDDIEIGSVMSDMNGK